MSTVPEHPDLFSSFRKVSDILTNPISPMKVHDIINPRRACAARVTVLGLCVSVCVFVTQLLTFHMIVRATNDNNLLSSG